LSVIDEGNEVERKKRSMENDDLFSCVYWDDGRFECGSFFVFFIEMLV
jgi:hypothetical protein